MVLAVNGYNESKSVVEKFVKQKGLKQKMLLMGSEVARKKFAVNGYPTSFLIDRQGVIVEREVGFGAGMAGPTEKKIRKLLGKQPKGENDA